MLTAAALAGRLVLFWSSDKVVTTNRRITSRDLDACPSVRTSDFGVWHQASDAQGYELPPLLAGPLRTWRVCRSLGCLADPCVLSLSQKGLSRT